MLVVLVVRDEQPRLVQPRRPAEELLRVLGVEPPGRSHLTVQRERGRGDTPALRGVDAVALDAALHGRVADVLVADAADEVEQQPFAQRHLRHVEVLDAERVEGGGEHRDAAREHRPAVVPELPEPHRVHVPGPDQLAPQAGATHRRRPRSRTSPRRARSPRPP